MPATGAVSPRFSCSSSGISLLVFLTLLCSSASAAWLLGSAEPAAAEQSAAAASTTTTAPDASTAADAALESVMLAAPLPGLTSFALVGPGATNGVLTAQTLGSYSNDPSRVEDLYNQYSAESGFAGWIKTWQDATGTNQVVEIALRFHDAQEATTNSAAFASTLAKGLQGGAPSPVASIPGASSFTINEPETTSGTTVVPAQQVQAVVFADGDYLIALHTDSPTGPDSQPIAPGTAVALGLQQYQDLQSVVHPGSATKAPAKAHAGTGGSVARTVGLALLGAVALFIALFAIVVTRRRGLRDEHRRSKSKQADDQGDNQPDKPEPVPAPPSPWVAASAPQEPTSTKAHRNGDGGRLVAAAAHTTPRPRSESISGSRARHPSAAAALASTRPPESAAGWYRDPSDTDRRRIRFWDGTSWTAHVAEPEN
jgi:Protein of unknown function (DUF2510)